ncbi:DUF1740-domain-containing protein [Penicillium capsulatum]|uniref:DUF1740-domain-containing protein n=1 Tax=Penicillium capsulatum TaxID=69766 RepID=A0A9W9HYK9_9EURO|nr:DUF1740-domain-containing protein [Penicillium capsulatum]KAJ6116627.1 DUF1740-domain-containing protein [Penicillium capsulatum]
MESSGSKDNKSIPKFGSFKLPGNSAATAASESSDRKPRGHDPRPSKSRRDDDRRQRHRYDRSRSPRRSVQGLRQKSGSHRSDFHDRRSPEEHQYLHKRDASHSRVAPAKENGSGKGLITDASATTASGFLIDRTGDRHNLTYGPSHRYSIPGYRRAGSGAVMGIPGIHKIDRRSLTEGTVVLRGDLGRTATSEKPLSHASNPPDQLFRIRKDEPPYSQVDLNRDFIPLKPARSFDGASDDEPLLYRSTQPQTEEKKDLDDVEPIPNEDLMYARLQFGADQERKERHAELQRDVTLRPTDVAAWLRLIDYQDILIRGPRETYHPPTAAERKGLADVKISLYEKALKKVGDSPHRDRLLLGRLEEGAQLWEPRTLLVEWNQTLEDHPDIISLWMKYIDFLQTDHVDFNAEQFFEVFIHCLDLVAPHEGSRKREIQSYIFLRMTLFLREAGYADYAVGLWQAVLEFMLFEPGCPTELRKKEPFVAAFFRFWETEIARVGEAGADGWGSGTSTEPGPVDMTFKFKLDPKARLTSWARAEREHMVKCRTPMRSVHATGEAQTDDANAVILVIDLERVLPLFWDWDTSEELIDAFLYFCHLPHLTLLHNALTTRIWGWDGFLRNEFVDNVSYGLEYWKPRQAPEDLAEMSPLSPFVFQVDNFLHNTDTFFAPPDRWFNSFRSLLPESPQHMSIIDPNWVQRTCQMFVERHPFDVQLGEYVLGLEFASSPSNARNLAKVALRRNPSSLRLWNALALIESQMGDQVKANQVFDNALLLAKRLSPSEGQERVLLWHSWVWEFLYRGQMPQASFLISEMSSGEFSSERIPESDAPLDFSPAALRRVEKFLGDERLLPLREGKAQAYVAYTDCLGLWYFLTEYPMEAALSAYTEGVKKLSSYDDNFKAYTSELLHQAQARFAYYIMTLPSIQSAHVQKAQQLGRSQVCRVLRESVVLFPHNTMFRSLYMWADSGLSQMDRVRDSLDLGKVASLSDPYQRYGDFTPRALGRQSIPVSTHLFSIFMEVCRPTMTGATAHSVRAAFERAIGGYDNLTGARSAVQNVRHHFSAESARSNLTVWKFYILWELYHARSLEAAKKVFFRAIQACPWSKDLVMMAFEYLRDELPSLPAGDVAKHGFKGVELRQLYRLMEQRDLRVFVDMDRPLRTPNRRHSLHSIAEDDTEDDSKYDIQDDIAMDVEKMSNSLN